MAHAKKIAPQTGDVESTIPKRPFGRDLWIGFRQCFPLAISAGMYGAVLGVLAGQKGVNIPELIAMNAMMFAGAAQFVVVDMWDHHPLPIAAIIVAAFIVNLRYFLMCAALRPIFSGSKLWKYFVCVFLTADENWALTLSEKDKGAGPGHLLGGGSCILLLWMISTILGHQFGSLIKNPDQYGIGFALTATFIALAIGTYKDKRDILPWIVAAVTAGLTWAWIPGKWYILVGGTLGSLVAALTNPTPEEKLKEPCHAD